MEEFLARLPGQYVISDSATFQTLNNYRTGLLVQCVVNPDGSVTITVHPEQYQPSGVLRTTRVTESVRRGVLRRMHYQVRDAPPPIRYTPEETIVWNDGRSKIKFSAAPVFSGTFPAENVWVGQSPACGMTNFSGGNGPRFDGNSVVIEDRGDNPRLIIIHCDRIETVPLSATVALHSSTIDLAGSRVIAYSSPVGNNFVPYPTVYLRSASNDLLLYLVLEGVFIRAQTDPAPTFDLLNDGPYQLWYCLDRKCSNGKLVGWDEYCDCTEYCLRTRNGSEALRKSVALVGDSAKVEVATFWERLRPTPAEPASDEEAPEPREDGLIVQNIYTLVRTIDISSDESSDEILSEDESASDDPPAAEP